MSSSLKEQLLKLGLAKEKRAEAKPRPCNAPALRPPPQPASAPSRHGALPNARQQRELDREREARNKRLRELVESNKLDAAQAEITHYYSTGKKIKRVYVTEAQQAALLRGEIVIVVVQGKGRLVPAALLPRLREIDPEARVIDPSAVAPSDDDPAHAVPDDLRW